MLSLTLKYPFFWTIYLRKGCRKVFFGVFSEEFYQSLKHFHVMLGSKKREYSRHRWVLHAADWLCVSPLVQIAVLPPYCATLQPLDRQVTLIIRAGVEEIFYHHKIKFFGILSHPITACATRPTRLAAASPSAPGAPWRIHRGWTREMG